MSNKKNERNLFFHDLLNHLHQIQLLSSAQINLGKKEKYIIQHETWAAIKLAKEYKAKLDQAKKTQLASSSSSEENVESFVTEIKNYFELRNLKINLESEKNLHLFNMESSFKIEGIFSNIWQNIQRHGDLSKEIYLNFKIVGPHLLVSIRNKTNKKNNRFYFYKTSGGGLESIYKTCHEIGGKCRFDLQKDTFYTRLFFPVKPNCPLSENIAA